jgi:Type II secretion system (T2SS), protein G
MPISILSVKFDVQSLEKFHFALTFTSLPPGYVRSMSATWTCICGTTFLDYGAGGDVIRCPECGFVVGESLPTHFESPVTFQSELPPERVALASPEVAVQATEPTVKSSSTTTIDELAEPDIRVKADRSWIIWLAFGIVFCAVAFLVSGYLWVGQLGVDQRDTAQIQVKALAVVCDAYKVKHGKYPDTLATLLERDEFGAIWLDDPAKLIDPWGRRYQYDPKGTNNNGLHPDIWVVTPDDGTIIGNWPRLVPKE